VGSIGKKEIPHVTCPKGRLPLRPNALGNGVLLLWIGRLTHHQSPQVNQHQYGAGFCRCSKIMSEGYSIEVGDEIVGMVVREDGEWGFRFHAAVKAVDPLDGHIFSKPSAAELAAQSHIASAVLRSGTQFGRGLPR